MNKLNQLYMEMIRYYESDAPRIQHFVKVHSFARLIGEAEGLDEETQFTLEAAALVHDIGIGAAEERSMDSATAGCGEQEGPPLAEEMLEALNFDRAVTERVCYLVAHHHTYEPVDGLDYRILLEADALVNLYEEETPAEGIRESYKHLFRTETAQNRLQDHVQIEEQEEVEK